MGRIKNKFQLKRDVYVPWDILESEAFETLSATGIRVFLRFLQKRTWAKAPAGKGKKKTVFNNGRLTFTYAEAKSMGISTSQFHTVLKKLIEVGFIDVEHQGGGIARDYSRYAISERWRRYGTGEFQFVEKKRRLWPGQDVRSRMDKIKETMENRSYQLRKIVTINDERMIQGAG